MKVNRLYIKHGVAPSLRDCLAALLRNSNIRHFRCAEAMSYFIFGHEEIRKIFRINIYRSKVHSGFNSHFHLFLSLTCQSSYIWRFRTNTFSGFRLLPSNCPRFKLSEVRRPLLMKSNKDCTGRES